jgi:hypothetical protein
MSKTPATPTLFEQAGFGKYDKLPEFNSFALFKTPEGWAVAKMRVYGDKIREMSLVCEPAIRSIALEQYRIAVARDLVEGLK